MKKFLENISFTVIKLIQTFKTQQGNMELKNRIFYNKQSKFMDLYTPYFVFPYSFFLFGRCPIPRSLRVLRLCSKYIGPPFFLPFAKDRKNPPVY